MIPPFKEDVVKAFGLACEEAGFSRGKNKLTYAKEVNGLIIQLVIEYKKMCQAYEDAVYIVDPIATEQSEDARVFTMIMSTIKAGRGSRRSFDGALDPSRLLTIEDRVAAMRGPMRRMLKSFEKKLPDVEALRAYVRKAERPFPWLVPAAYIELVKSHDSER
jgi:hypothetical protein